MDITLERVLSLIPRKENGDFVHGAKKEFCETIGAPPNIVNEWVRGASKSYRRYLYAITDKYNVSMNWLVGNTDKKEKSPAAETAELDADALLIIELLGKLTPSNRDRAIAYLQGLVAGQS